MFRRHKLPLLLAKYCVSKVYDQILDHNLALEIAYRYAMNATSPTLSRSILGPSAQRSLSNKLGVRSLHPWLASTFQTTTMLDPTRLFSSGPRTLPGLPGSPSTHHNPYSFPAVLGEPFGVTGLLSKLPFIVETRASADRNRVRKKGPWISKFPPPHAPLLLPFQLPHAPL